MPARSDEAFVLARYPYRERDLIVALLTRQAGQVRALVRRARGGHAPPAAALEPLARVRVSYFERAQVELANLDEVVSVRSTFALASQPEAWAAAQVVAELALTYCPPGQRQEPAFRLLDRCLEALLSGVDAVKVAAYADLWFLRLGGVFPELEACGACGEPIETPGRVLDVGEGWFSCAEHAPARGGVTLSGPGVAWLREALRHPVERLVGDPDRNCVETIAALRRRFTEREVRSWAYLSRLTLDAPGSQKK